MIWSWWFLALVDIDTRMSWNSADLFMYVPIPIKQRSSGPWRPLDACRQVILKRKLTEFEIIQVSASTYGIHTCETATEVKSCVNICLWYMLYMCNVNFKSFFCRPPPVVFKHLRPKPRQTDFWCDNLCHRFFLQNHLLSTSYKSW